MILHIYHCNRVVLRDRIGAKGRNRPGPIARFPPYRGGADFEYRPPTDGFGDRKLEAVLELFTRCDLLAEDSPVAVNWSVTEDLLGMRREEIEEMLGDAQDRGLLPSLTIDYNHERWMQQSLDKGCLAILTCIEPDDLPRPRSELVREYVATVRHTRSRITNGAKRLDHAVVMPNAHFNPRGIPVAAEDRDQCIELLEALTAGLGEDGWTVHLNSYGYSKMIELAINAHPLGYVLRVV